MPRASARRPSVSASYPPRRPGLLLESLEARRLLSTASGTTITPAVAAVAAVTNPTPVSTALTPSQVAAAYSINQSSSTGSGQTIAIVDAYNDPKIQADPAT